MMVGGPGILVAFSGLRPLAFRILAGLVRFSFFDRRPAFHPFPGVTFVVEEYALSPLVRDAGVCASDGGHGCRSVAFSLPMMTRLRWATGYPARRQALFLLGLLRRTVASRGPHSICPARIPNLWFPPAVRVRGCLEGSAGCVARSWICEWARTPVFSPVNCFT